MQALLSRPAARTAIGVLVGALVALSLTSIRPASADTASSVNVVELFTSHGCSSCPPADALLGELIENDPTLIALAFHVDYWNDLVHGADGNWVDPFSSPAHTQRQQRYARQALAGQPGVYTPQAIVNGRHAAVGSDTRRIHAALGLPTPAAAQVTIAASATGYDITVVSDDSLAMHSDTGIYLVTFQRHARTEITAGENRHRTLDNHNIVTDMTRLGAVESGRAQRFSVTTGVAGTGASAGAADQGCAVLVQSDALSALYGAALCP